MRSLRFFVAALLMTAGCARGPETAQPPAAQSEVKSTVERGPVKVEVKISPSPARLSGEPKLTLTIDAELGVEATPPPFGEALGDFVIRDFQDHLPETREGRQIIRQEYTLEPTRAGMLQVAPIAVAFTDKRPQGDGKQHVLQTEALSIEVESMVDSEAPSLEDLQGLDDPVELPAAWPVWFWLLLLAVGLAAATVVLLLVAWRRPSTPSAEPAVPPQELARRELTRLLAARDMDIKMFYTELTGIVRRYIERTTSIHAPEQTTEEFLAEIGQSDVFSGGQRQRLKAFLESADLVKFAAYRPCDEDVADAVERARAFLGLSAGKEA